MNHFLQQSWPWYVGGVLIGLTVPALLIAGNKLLGVSSSLRQICAACFPFNVSFLNYDWKKEQWNLFFAAGLVLDAHPLALAGIDCGNYSGCNCNAHQKIRSICTV